MKTIILFYEHKAREYDMCQLLKNKLEQIEDVDVYIWSYHWQKIDALKLLNDRVIDCILIPFAYTNSDLEFYKKFYVKNPKMIIANLHHEELTCPIWDDLILPREYMAKDAIIHFVWTETFKKLLEDSGVNPNLIYVIGNVRNDLSRISTINRQDIAKKFYLDLSKKWLLFAEDRMLDKEAVLLNLSNPDEKKYYDEDVKSLNETIKQMEELSNDFFNKYELIYRLHPGSSNITLENNKVRIIKEYSIYDWFNCIDALIVSKSTTSFEADMNGISVFFHNPFDTDETYLMPGVNRYFMIHKLDEINENILMKAEILQKENEIYKEYMGENDGNNANRMVECIIELLKKENKKTTCFATEYSKLYYAKRFIRGYLFRVYKKSGLFSLIKKPAVFYYNQEDIPF